MLLEQIQRGQAPAAPKAKTPEEKAAEQFETLVDQRIAQRDAQREQRTQMETFAKRAAEARTKYDDWDDAIAALDIPTASPLGQALLTSDHGPELMYQLATDPARLAQLNALPPFAAAREIGKLEAKLSGDGTPTKPAPPTKRPPTPPSSVGGSTPSPTRDISSLPLADYKREQRKRLKR